MAEASKTRWFQDLLQNLFNRFHLHDPHSSPVRKGQEVWLLDNTAFRSTSAPEEWTAEFVAAYFSEDSGKDISKIVAELADKFGLAEDEAAKKRIAERVEPFLSMILSAKTVEVDFGSENAGRLKLGPAENKGISVNEMSLPGGGYVDDQIVESSAVLEEGEVIMRTAFAQPEGWGVISDIDDTIKLSEVRDRLSLLKNTFALPPTPITGMPELYSSIQKRLSKPVWFYLSASPYNLYPLLRSFTSEFYPRGQLILREMSWMEIESFIVSLTVGTKSYKEERMETVLRWLPKRRWVLIGDSTQTDPEAYATIYKSHPDKIHAIWIRKVVGVDENKEKSLNDPKRFLTAFEAVPKNIWRIFENPQELEVALEALVAV